MSNTGRKHRWLALVADNTGTTLYAATGKPPRASLISVGQVRYELDDFDRRKSLPELEQFVAKHGLAGCTAHLRFAGAGTVVHKLHMPNMSVRRRTKAIRTRLQTYAAGRELCIDQQSDPRGRNDQGLDVLAAGTEAALVRGLGVVLRKAGLRVDTATALTAACSSPSDQGQAIQVVLGERTTAVQLFTDGRLVFCRDILLGRKDFVTAYQRPILSAAGPITLSPEQAEQLARQVGVPMDREETVLESIRPDQLWPLITPVLQRLRNEIQQTVSQHWEGGLKDAALNVLCLPNVPGLGDYLAAELRLPKPLVPTERIEAEYLAVLFGGAGRSGWIDLSPPEERFVKRMSRPALAAGFCALLVIFSNVSAPRTAQAEMGQLEPAITALQLRLEQVRAQLSSAQEKYDQLVAELTAKTCLTEALPPCLPVIEVAKELFESVPANIELLDVSMNAAALPAGLELLAAYHGQATAGGVAADWVRKLTDSPFFTEAEVTAVIAGGQDRYDTIALRVSMQ